MIILEDVVNQENLLSNEGRFKYQIMVNKIICNITLLYIDNQLQAGWFLTLYYNGTTINNIRLVLSNNILAQYLTTLDIGLAVYTTQTGDTNEPLLKTDFFTGRVKLAILESSAEATL